MSTPTDGGDRPIALFDFDGTLTVGDTLMPFLKYVAGAPRYYAKLALVSPVLGAYLAGCIRNDVAKQWVLKQYLAGYSMEALWALGTGFSASVVPAMLRPEGVERLRWHQALGHRCILVSASMDVYLDAWAKQAHFSELICTTLERDTAGLVTGRIQGRNCHGDEKLRRWVAWQKGKREVPVYAYGDSSTDIALLRYAHHGFMWHPRTRRFVPVNAL